MNPTMRAVAVCCLTAALGCNSGTNSGNTDGQEQVAQSAGESMASLDEMNRDTLFGLITPNLQRRPEFQPPWHQRAVEWMLPSAHAAACTTLAFSSCLSGVRTLDLDACTLGGITLDGTVELSFSDTLGCLLGTVGTTITRTADFTLSANGVTVAVTSEGGGQQITRTANGFTYRELGVRRVGTGANGTVLFDVSTRTTADVTVTGTSRATRVVSGGTLVIEHNVRDYTVSLTPDAVSWTANCNCPTSGTLSGSVSGSVTGTALVTFTGCGTANVDWNGTTASVQLDRCFGS